MCSRIGGLRPLGPQNLEVDSGRDYSSSKADSVDTSAPTNHIVAAKYRSLKSVGRREHGNVI
ncbi:hypothetical protein DET54_102420 [Paenibacillus pabuli]|uniref:Uncharacterized protein n=1 Tax=Paenibacillus pabuli TaxID=1472 RepID=A0A855XU97_9BACL|nr:hypothetical protein DET56_106303 [Paenibacillus pabuli]PXW06617.1 hypothetical protein DEU73_106131 [Paenibacillus taichungensis]RAJ00933.1 hypothetical protein DET54_102420 [Paenibacillus pabuli]